MKRWQIVLFYLVAVCAAFAADISSVPPQEIARQEIVRQMIAREIARHKALEEEVIISHIFGMNTNAASHLSKGYLLAITVIGDRALVWWSCDVWEHGSRVDYRFTRQTIQPGRWGALTEKELSDLRAAVAELPEQSASPPLGRTALVSYQSGTNWLTRTYDFKQQPVALRRIFQIIGEREDLKAAP